MRRLILRVGSALAWACLCAGSVEADDASPRERAEAEAKRIARAYSDGVAPEPAAGREARRALEEFVAGLSDTERGKTRLAAEALDPLLAKAAWAAGDLAVAHQRAEATLAAATKAPKDWDRGNILHEMNILLGRIALEREDLAQAKQRLLDAGATPGSPQLDTFGPDWTLASDLLARGERATVLTYLDRVGAFWESGRDRLATWRKSLEEGGTPELVPKRRERGKAKGETAPPVELPSTGPAKSIVGLWESMSKSGGGIGSALEFRADGRVLQRLVVLVDSRYRVENDQLSFLDEAGSPPRPLGKFEADTWTVAVGATSMSKKRVGAATPGASPLVGTWEYTHPTGAKAFERYRSDGWLSLRVLMAGLSSGGYTLTGTELGLTFSGQSVQGFTATLAGDRLHLISKDGKEREYRYAGEKPWYDLAAGGP